jgi:hypothetical protein
VQLPLDRDELVALMQDSLESLAVELGLLVASDILEDEVARLCGARYQHQPDRTHTVFVSLIFHVDIVQSIDMMDKCIAGKRRVETLAGETRLATATKLAWLAAGSNLSLSGRGGEQPNGKKSELSGALNLKVRDFPCGGRLGGLLLPRFVRPPDP